MNKFEILKFANKLGVATKKHSSEIMIGFGIMGMFIAEGMAVLATPGALIKIAERKEELKTEKLDGGEIIKATWKSYLPSVTLSVVSAGCIIGGTSSNLRRNATLAAAYALSESTLREYQSKVIENIGEKKEKAIREEVAKEKIIKNPVEEVILTERGGNTTCYDTISGRYFKSDKTTIERAVNKLNRQMRDDIRITLNEFYYELGLASIKVGDNLGWDIDNGYIDINFSSHLDATGMPCLVLDYRVAPIYSF